MRTAAGDSWSDLFSRVLVERIEPKLGQGRLTILCEYPAEEAALARPLARRRALCGAVRALCLRRRAGERLWRTDGPRRTAPPLRRPKWMRKSATYGERYPLDEDFLAALAHMPPASGVALGFDRLVMLATARGALRMYSGRRRSRFLFIA